MITTQFLVYIINRLKKLLSRLTCPSTRLLFFFLSLLRRGSSKLGNRSVPTSHADVAEENDNVSIYPSLLPPRPKGLDVTVDLSHSDDLSNYTTRSRFSRPSCEGTTMTHLSGTNTTTKAYPSAADIDGLHPDSMSSSHLSLQPGEGPVNNTAFQKVPSQSSSPISSSLSVLHGSLRAHSGQQRYTSDSHCVTTPHTPSMTHPDPNVPDSRFTCDSNSASTGPSLTRSIAAAIPSRPVSIHSSISGGAASVPLDVPSRALAVSDPIIDSHAHFPISPGSSERPGSGAVMVYEGPSRGRLVADEIRQYHEYSIR
jgi:hypothetical protein